MEPHSTVIEIIGWTSTVLFITSFLVKRRSALHLIGFVACIFKMVYSYHYHVWPLFVNWVILLGVSLYQWLQYHKKEMAVAEASVVAPPPADDIHGVY